MNFNGENKLKRSIKFDNALNQRYTLNNLGKTFTLSPIQKYKNALINLREGLSELETLNVDKNKKTYNTTFNNTNINNYFPTYSNRNTINQTGIINNNYLIKNKKNVSSSKINKINNNSFVPISNNQLDLSDLNSGNYKRINPLKKDNAIYTKIRKSNENNQQNNLLTTDNNLVKKNQLYQKKNKRID